MQKYLDSYYDEDFLSKSDELAAEVELGEIYANEIFLRYVQPLELFKHIYDKLSGSTHWLSEGVPSGYYHIYRDFLVGINDYRFKKLRLAVLTSSLQASLSLTLSFFYLFGFICATGFRPMPPSQVDLFLARTKSSKTKLNNARIQYFSTDVWTIKGSIYGNFRWIVKVRWLLISFRRSFLQLNVIEGVVKRHVGLHSALDARRYYAKRIMEVLFYEHMLNAVLEGGVTKNLYSANNLDRFAWIEQRACDANRVRMIGIPHGLEYGFRLPLGFASHIFYTTSKLAAEHLNKLYESSKYIFDYILVNDLMRIPGNERRESSREIVYFTEPRDIHIDYDIIKTMVILSSVLDINFNLKYHPKSLKSDYSQFNLKSVDSLSVALTHEFCISRKSTVLYESVLNEAVAIAVLLTSKDRTIFNSFPTLKVKGIFVASSLKELEVIVQELFSKREKEDYSID